MVLVGVLLAALALGLFFYFRRTAYSRLENFPPGPPKIPIWGGYLQLLLENYKYPYRVLDAMTRRYKSKLVGFYFGPLPVVVASDYDSVREATNNPHLQGRILNIGIKQRMPDKELGLVFVEGSEWMEQRRFVLRNMRDFGFGRRSDRVETECEAELRDFVALIRGERDDQAVVRASSRGKSTQEALLPNVLYAPFLNALMIVISGTRLPRSMDESARSLALAALQSVRSSDTTGGFLTLHPWLSIIAPKLSGYKDAVEGAAKVLGYAQKLIEDHLKTYSDDCMRDFIDVYLREMKHREKSGEPTSFSTDHLATTLLDMFLPTTTVQSSAITYALIFTARHPEVQGRVQQELDSVVGRGRLPSLNDRQSLPYTEATLRETMRIQTLLPISIPHRAMEDTTLQGYTVPKGTAVVSNLYSLHMDKERWGDPKNFRPERFLESDGKLSKKDFTLPFSAGKRLCPGETFSRQNMFLTYATLLQNFTIKADGVPVKNINIPGAIETPPAFWAQFEAR